MSHAQVQQEWADGELRIGVGLDGITSAFAGAREVRFQSQVHCHREAEC